MNSFLVETRMVPDDGFLEKRTGPGMPCFSHLMIGGGGWTRTTDIGLMRPPLCQLSYAARGWICLRLCPQRSPPRAGRMIEKRWDSVKPHPCDTRLPERIPLRVPNCEGAIHLRHGWTLLLLQELPFLIPLPLDVFWLVIFRVVHFGLLDPPVEAICDNSHCSQSE